MSATTAKPVVQLVWFKRDLRVVDHAPLAAAAQWGTVLPLYIIEPDYWQLPDTSDRQWQWIAQALRELDQDLRALGQGLLIREGDAVAVLDALAQQVQIEGLYSHQETGNHWTYQRDRAVAQWARARGIAWQQYPQFGVARPQADRDGWAAQWERLISAPPVASPTRLLPLWQEPLPPLQSARGFDRTACPGRQSGGRQAGLAALDSFLDHRGQQYLSALSSPLLAADGGSRLSPYLAYGCLSLREVVQRVRGQQRPGWRRALRALESRLHWHCHFIQKLEDEPALEWRNAHRGFDGLREAEFDPELFQAWCAGRTGFPFIDACQAFLAHHGWLNFRMRAMLVAFASYHLWLHWREPALFLARRFVDYEPGIHYNQMQMQAGTTGINAWRIYNPVKQSFDQDPDGRFIRQWLPALARVPNAWVHTPWRMNASQQHAAGCVIGEDYPPPIVDHERAARQARTRMKAHVAGQDMRAETARVLKRHGSRQGRKPRTPRNVSRKQLTLDFE